jgi:dTDP-4-amino-4,6-dideoxygalactose transaminase
MTNIEIQEEIPFNLPPYLGIEDQYLQQAILNRKLCGDGAFTQKSQKWLEHRFKAKKVLLTPSCTAALEMAAILIDIQPNDEVIMPSYTFVSTANAFVLRGAKIVFVDIDPKTMNIDHQLIESAITTKTKAIVPVHYAGVSCDMKEIMSIAAQYGLFVIEDAAQGVMSFYRDQALGTIGHLGCYSFHETKNYTAGGEGGALIINDDRFLERAEVIREKGTDRSLFFKGLVDKYTWRDIGSSFLMSELQAAYLYAQLENIDLINQYRLNIWQTYHQAFQQIKSDTIQLAEIPNDCIHNAHIYYLKIFPQENRTHLINNLKQNKISAPFHYLPLHLSPAGMKYGTFHGDDRYTSSHSTALIRLPLFYGLKDKNVTYIIEKVIAYLQRNISI